MDTYSHIAIIYNPKSTGNSQAAAERLAKHARPHLKRCTLELVATRHAGHAEELAYELARRHGNPLIVSSSGDGGYHEVINGAMRAQAEGAKPVCAVLPAGNANDHHNDTSQSPLEHAILRGKPQRIDLLEVTTATSTGSALRYAHSYLGLGLTPMVAIELNRHTLSALRELVIVLGGFLRFRPFQIEADGETLTLDSLIVSNIGRMAKIFALHRSPLDDGTFEVTIFPHGHKLKLLWRLAQAAMKGLRPDRSTDEYSFTALKDMPIQLDGEVAELRAGDTVTIKSARKLLRTLV